MKKVLSLFLFLIISFSVFSQSYKSNLLMQKLSSDVDSEYLLIVEGNKESLFKGNELVKVSETAFDYSFEHLFKTVSCIDISKNIKEVFTYTDSLLTNYFYEDKSESYTISFSYSDSGVLIFSTKTSGESIDTECYLRDSISGNLIGIKKADSYIWTGNNYLVSGEYLLTEVVDGVYIEDDFFINENYIIYNKDDIEYTYANNGLLLSVKEPLVTTEYFYNDNNSLLYTVKTEENKKTISNYSDGRLTESSTYVSDKITESVVYKPTGKVQTLYSNEIAIAEVQYDKNNIKVLDIRYFK